MSDDNYGFVSIKKNRDRISELEKKVSDIRNRILNIKPNNELFIKIMRMQQQIDELKEDFKIHFRADKDYDLRYRRQLNELKEHWTRQQEEIDHLLRMNDSGVEKVVEIPTKNDQKSLVSPYYACGKPKNHKTDSKQPEPNSYQENYLKYKERIFGKKEPEPKDKIWDVVNKKPREDEKL